LDLCSLFFSIPFGHLTPYEINQKYQRIKENKRLFLTSK
jgi:hypothetical protein